MFEIRLPVGRFKSELLVDVHQTLRDGIFARVGGSLSQGLALKTGSDVDLLIFIPAYENYNDAYKVAWHLWKYYVEDLKDAIVECFDTSRFVLCFFLQLYLRQMFGRYLQKCRV